MTSHRLTRGNYQNNKLDLCTILRIQLIESESLGKAQNLYCRELSLHIFMTKLNFQFIVNTRKIYSNIACSSKAFYDSVSSKVCVLPPRQDKHKTRQVQDFIMDMTITFIIASLFSACIWYGFIMLVFRVLMNMFKFL